MTIDDIPAFLVCRFEAGEVPCDDPPGLTEIAYRVWKEAGGVVTNPNRPTDPIPVQWAVVELLGHRRMAGRLTEEERFGAKLGRLDIPLEGDRWQTVYFGGGSVYCLSPCDEATARAVAANTAASPVHSYEMPQLARRVTEEEESEQRDFPDDDTPY